MIPAICASLNLQGSVLDIGCGPGINAEGLLKLGVSRYVGVDASVHQIQPAKNANLGDKATFLVGDVTKEEPPEALDVGLASFVVPHLATKKDIVALMRYLKRGTKAGAVSNVVIGDDYGVVRANNFARDSMFGPVCDHQCRNQVYPSLDVIFFF